MVIGTYICIDYHELSNTIENRFPIPRIDDILDRLGEAIFIRTPDSDQV